MRAECVKRSVAVRLRPIAAAIIAGAALMRGACPALAASDVVLYASDFSVIRGNWAIVSSASAAGGQTLSSTDQGWATPDTPLAAPSHYVEATFSAPSSTAFHVRLRLRAANDSKYNDSVWVQFSDALSTTASPLYSIGSTSALSINLENCASCGVAGWGWQDKAYWLQQNNVVQFASSGTHTIRIQTREDGVQVDQVVISPATYFSTSPGPVTNDSKIVPKSTTSTTTTTTAAASTSSTPYSGTPAAIPGQINAETFDNGGEGVAYHDTTAGNDGGQARSTDVDVEATSEGGYDIGWTAPGEWVNYTVNVATAGSYSVQLRVAAPSGASMHIAFTGQSSVSSAVSIPATGGWQSWTTVTVPVTLAAGKQVLKVTFDTAGSNFRYAKFVSNTTITAPAPAASPYTGSPVSLPGKIEAENFDNGGEGLGYHDTTAGNAGGGYRTTDVDIEGSSEGGYNVGWTMPGEWLNYTVNVPSAGTYTVQLRVASATGGQMHVGFNGASSVWANVSVPNTGAWQNWTTLNVSATLAAGVQQLTLLFDTAGINVNYITVVSGTVAVPPPPPPPPPTSTTGTEVIVAEWNARVDDSSAAHARTVIAYLAALSPQPQVLIIAEAHNSQYSTYITELQNRTALTWRGLFQPHCPPGAWNGSSCTTAEDEGVAVFTSLSVVGSSTTFLPYADSYHSARGVARLAISVNGTTVQVFGTHLQVSNATARNASMAYLKNWTSNFSAPQLLGGDFNADPDQIDTTVGMSPNFVDSWSVVGVGLGRTCNTPSPTMKLDYWFADASGKAKPNWSSVVSSTGTVSDHFPIHTSFTIRP